ncbi:hypothetical protein FFZ77_30330 [Streptomyces katsurahamanus]|uniref:Uncharacterized protein n=1 Tax=Streptomyces katsurahamanus TaxID=2577098 RepID=A0ABW9P2A0_9ACTN|nr:hypothetical protein [Streptomyces katsurahamanus]
MLTAENADSTPYTSGAEKLVTPVQRLKSAMLSGAASSRTREPASSSAHTAASRRHWLVRRARMSAGTLSKPAMARSAEPAKNGMLIIGAALRSCGRDSSGRLLWAVEGCAGVAGRPVE